MNGRAKIADCKKKHGITTTASIITNSLVRIAKKGWWDGVVGVRWVGWGGGGSYEEGVGVVRGVGGLGW